MWMLGKENLSKLSPVICSGYYSERIDYLAKIFRYSRQDKFQKPIELLALQVGLARLISQLESVVVQGKKERCEEQNTKKLKNIEIGIESNKQLARVAKVIADGIAWRILDFDRPFLRLMADAKKYFGSVELASKGYRKIMYIASDIAVNRKNKVLLNDITHFLRMGDITEVGKKTIIYEVKKSGDRLHSVYSWVRQSPNSGTSKQFKKVITAQIARDLRKIKTKNGTITIEGLPMEFGNNLDIVQKIIRKARKELFAYYKFDNYLMVYCSDLEKIIDYSLKTKKNIWEEHKTEKWGKSEQIIPFSNFDSFWNYEGDFIRTNTPYSIYPLNNKDCIDLMAGKLMLVSMLNLTEIKRLLTNAGWEVIDSDLEKMTNENRLKKQKVYSEGIYENPIDDTIFTLKRGAFHLKIPGYWAFRIATEFMKPKTLLEEVEFVYKTSKPPFGRLLHPHITDEANVWR